MTSTNDTADAADKTAATYWRNRMNVDVGDATESQQAAREAESAKPALAESTKPPKAKVRRSFT